MKKGKISKLIFGCMVYASVLSFSGQTGTAQDLPRAATPKTMVKAMDNYLKDVENSKQDLHSIMVLQHGKVIAAKWMGRRRKQTARIKLRQQNIYSDSHRFCRCRRETESDG